MSLKLIVNADDYGRTPGVSRGIREAHLNGIVTSTTCMINFPTAVSDLHLAAMQCPNLGLGLHLTLTSGMPSLKPEKLPDLVDTKGRFWSLEEFLARRGSIPLDQIRAEWQAQLEAFNWATGHLPDHLDAHHHIAYANAELFSMFCELAQQYHLPIRAPRGEVLNELWTWLDGPSGQEIGEAEKKFAELSFKIPAPQKLMVDFYDETATRESLLEILVSLPQKGTVELMCHPGHADADLMDPDTGSVYNAKREEELAVLCDTQIMESIQKRGIQLVNFSSLS
jgi:predicted glycoside hydrolase/deacetylase ChbG (UPF0249 family)